MAPAADDAWILASEAARRLDVKVSTLYSYVSRGLLRSRHDAGSRRSLFNAEEVQTLRRVHTRRTREQELAFESAVTVLGTDRPIYRGLDAVQLANTHTFEQVAEHLWGMGEAAVSPPWRARSDIAGAALAVQSQFPDEATLIDRIEIIVTLLAASDPLRSNTDPDAVPFTARSMIAALIDHLPDASGVGQHCDEPGSVAQRLWSRLTPAPSSMADLSVLNSAMVLLADHELAASTVAARVAASVRADPYSVVTAGLGVLRGPMHGGDIRRTEELLGNIVDVGSADRVLGAMLQRGQSVPGVGHLAYTGRDGRCDSLLETLHRTYPSSPFLQAAQAVRRHIVGKPANVDLALAAFTGTAGMVPGAGEGIFAISRIAGWLAHAMEEYRFPTRLRPRAIYLERP